MKKLSGGCLPRNFQCLSAFFLFNVLFAVCSFYTTTFKMLPNKYVFNASYFLLDSHESKPSDVGLGAGNVLETQRN